jgi:hypothetical protein
MSAQDRAPTPERRVVAVQILCNRCETAMIPGVANSGVHTCAQCLASVTVAVSAIWEWHSEPDGTITIGAHPEVPQAQ